MFKTIKSQILLALVILIALMLSQVFLSRNIQSTFFEGLNMTQEAITKVSLVKNLERDVIDLQRNVLIYKDLADESSINRFNTLIQENLEALDNLENLTIHEDHKDVYLDYIKRMRSHLNDYQENFKSVIVGRTKRHQIYQNGVLEHLEALFDDIDGIQNMHAHNKQHIQTAKYHLALAETHLMQYLLTPELSLVEPFQKHLNDAKIFVKQAGEDGNAQITLALESLAQVEDEFLQLTKVTRGYLFLVNVVMAGSANEFLFLSHELNKLVTETLNNTNEKVRQALDTTRISNNVFSAFEIIAAITIALFLAYKIMFPIETITNIFRKLAKGQNVSRIPNLAREDEIGHLAQAADVFHKKNKQTTYLLEQSQLLNAKQEVLNKQLVASNKKAEQATASKSMFLANMSHEIRTPMNGIIGMLEILQRSPLTPEQKSQLNKAAYSGQILLSLINDILDFSKIEAGKLDIENIEFDANAIFNNILANIVSRAQDKNLNIRFYVNPELPNILIGDPFRINQVLLNLCNNAIKFTRNGSVLINVDFSYKNDKKGLLLNLAVKDSGVGMSQKQMDKVFDSFTQADGSTSRNFGGTGLGLSIVKQLVNLMGGDISVTSEKGKGSTFTATISLTAVSTTNFLISSIPSTQQSVYYFSSGRQSLIPNAYLEKVEVDYHHMPLANLSSILGEIKDRDVVVIDIEEHTSLESFFDPVNTLQNRAMKVGFVSNFYPKSLLQQAQNLWPIECLSHPFTPQQSKHFLMTLLNKNEVTSQPASEQLPMQNNAKYTGHVLLVEDNEINQAVAGNMLSFMGATFDVAEDGHTAIAKLGKPVVYNLVLMDIQMPLIDGYEATREIRRLGHTDLIICGLSANAMQQDYHKAEKAGMNDYLTKPITHEKLENMLAKYLQLKTG